LDQIGLAYAYNKIDEVAVGEPLSHKNEQIIEGYWAWGIGNMLTITPDIQFYINPALNQKSEYGVATSLRATVFF
jgi:carbohydrate-selective porin OprB